MAHITESDFKESSSVSIVSEVIESNHKCKAYFRQEDKIPYTDGYIGILQRNVLRLVVDVQIRTLEEGSLSEQGFSFSCETKILNYVRFSVTSNPTALFVADKKSKRVFFKMLSHEYVDSLNIGSKEHKSIRFEAEDEYSDDKFISQAFHLAKIIDTDTDCFVDCGKIKSIFRKAGKTDYQPQVEETEVYSRGKIKGYFSAFRIKIEGKHRYNRDGYIKMVCEDDVNYAMVRFKKGYIEITRQPSDSLYMTDADFGNIALEIAKEAEKSDMPVWYFHEGPVFWFNGAHMYQMKSRNIYLPWYIRY